MADEKPRVVIGMPRYNSTACFESVRAMLCWATTGDCEIVSHVSPGLSLLNDCFNRIWCMALNLRKAGATHFAMIHSDIVPDAGWLDVLIGELTRLEADMVGAVVPMKNSHGLTSTAIQTEADNVWMRRRLTMKEVFELPETFGSDDVGGPLLLNTGLWVCDLRKSWCENIWFETMERIVKDENGDFHPQVVPEDWLWSGRLNHLGAKLYATRKVKLLHNGERLYPNEHVWGGWETDENYQTYLKDQEKALAAA